MRDNPAQMNCLAAVLAEAMCKGRNVEEIAEIIYFLNLLAANIRSYL